MGAAGAAVRVAFRFSARRASQPDGAAPAGAARRGSGSALTRSTFSTTTCALFAFRFPTPARLAARVRAACSASSRCRRFRSARSRRRARARRARSRRGPPDPGPGCRRPGAPAGGRRGTLSSSAPSGTPGTRAPRLEPPARHHRRHLHGAPHGGAPRRRRCLVPPGAPLPAPSLLPRALRGRGLSAFSTSLLCFLADRATSAGVMPRSAARARSLAKAGLASSRRVAPGTARGACIASASAPLNIAFVPYTVAGCPPMRRFADRPIASDCPYPPRTSRRARARRGRSPPGSTRKTPRGTARSSTRSTPRNPRTPACTAGTPG